MARAEQLLRVAAEWEPEHEAPADLMDRTLAHMERRSPFTRWMSRCQRSLGGWGLGTVGLAAAAFALVLIRPNLQTDLTPPRPAAPLSSYTWSKSSGSTSQGYSGAARSGASKNSGRASMIPASYDSALPGTVGGPVAVAPEETEVESGSVPEKPESRRPQRNSRTPRRPARPSSDRSVALWGKLMTEVKECLTPKAPVWQEETVPVPPPQEEYHVVMPVMFAETTADNSNTTAAPAVMELTINPSPKP